MEDYENEISQIIDKLKKEYNNLILLNPYLLKVLANKKISKIKVSYLNQDDLVSITPEQAYKEFKRYDIFRMLLLFILGIFVCVALVCGYCYYKAYTTKSAIFSTNLYENWDTAFSLLRPWAVSVIAFICVVALLVWSRYLVSLTGSKAFFNASLGLAAILLFVLSAQILRVNVEILLFICPLLGYFVLLLSLIFIYKPLSHKELNETIINSTRQIQDKLDSMNASSVQKSHLAILNRIGEVSEIVIGQKKNTNELIKIQSLSVLDSLRLELIQNTINGINLVEDWKYLDLSQRMIDDIISCDNKSITILGDFSFLSTEKGLEDLVTAIQEKEKEFNIYFTGEKKGSRHQVIIESTHCQGFVDLIKSKYSGNSQVIDSIIKYVHLHPILPNTFTGIGFIGLINNDETDKYDKVYAYISSHLITKGDPDITRANPFVFCWDSNQTKYFKNFINNKVITDVNLSVMINGKATKGDQILSTETLTVQNTISKLFKNGRNRN